jgi:hypothetical protein
MGRDNFITLAKQANKEGVGSFFQDLLEMMWENGTKIRFWHNLWCEDQQLKESFPELFSIACYKEVWVADHLQFSNENIQWNISFIKPVQDWEVELVTAFFNALDSLKVGQGGDDSIWWIPSKQWKFEVRPFYQTLSTLSSSSFPCKTICKVKVPSRVNFFVWTTALGKLPTLDNLRKKKVIVAD